MKVEAVKPGAGTGPISPGVMANMESQLILGAFEVELDSLIELIDADRSPATSEAIMKRFAMAQEIHDEIRLSMSRISLKLKIANERLLEGISFEDG